jgi:hypothetical protein
MSELKTAMPSIFTTMPRRTTAAIELALPHSLAARINQSIAFTWDILNVQHSPQLGKGQFQLWRNHEMQTS